MRQANEQNRPASARFRIAIKHFVLCCFSFLIALTAMSRVKGGWIFEPLIWLTLVWYLMLLLICDFIILRGRGRIGTLFIIVTGVAIVIMFPFTAIQKSNYRAQFRVGTSKRHEKVNPIGFWNWWEVAPREFVPRCLAWRVPINGIKRWGVFKCTSKELVRGDYPEWFLQEVDDFRFSLQADDVEPEGDQRFPEERMRPGLAYISRARDTKSAKFTEPRRPSLDWLLKCIDFRNCSALAIHDVDFSNESWNELLTSERIFRMEFYDTNIENIFTDSTNQYEELLWLSLVRVPNIRAQEVIETIDRCPNLQDISLSTGLLQPTLLRKLFSESAVFAIRFEGDRDELKLAEPIKVNSPKQLHISNYAKINFTDNAIRSLFSGCEIVYLDKCRFTAIELNELSKIRSTEIQLSECSISKSEYERLMAMGYVARERLDSELSQPEFEGDYFKIRNWLNRFQLQIED